MKTNDSPWRRYLLAAPAVAAALVLLIVISFRNGNQTASGIRIKGEENIDMSQTQIIIYRKTGENIDVLKSGDKAQNGDLLQLAYVPAGKVHGVVLSIDGNGVVTLHSPDNDRDSTLLAQDQKTLLQTSYELDDAPGFERFFFVTSWSKLDVGTVMESARILAADPTEAARRDLKLPDTMDQFSIILIKGE